MYNTEKIVYNKEKIVYNKENIVYNKENIVYNKEKIVYNKDNSLVFYWPQIGIIFLSYSYYVMACIMNHTSRLILLSRVSVLSNIQTTVFFLLAKPLLLMGVWHQSNQFWHFH